MFLQKLSRITPNLFADVIGSYNSQKLKATQILTKVRGWSF
jgi:hypothetical protein